MIILSGKTYSQFFISNDKRIFCNSEELSTNKRRKLHHFNFLFYISFSSGLPLHSIFLFLSSLVKISGENKNYNLQMYMLEVLNEKGFTLFRKKNGVTSFLTPNFYSISKD